MEVRKGYKQTDVGIIPEDWEVRRLGSILKVVGGGAFRSVDSSSTGVKWLKISNVGINQAIWDDESYLPTELIKSNENFLLKENDYVLALTRPILDRKLKITRLKKNDVPALLNQRVGKIETEKGNSIEFAYYLFQKFETINALIQSMAGTDPPNLGNWGIYNVNCAIPPTLQEQTAIATALSDTDALISSLEKLIAKKRNIKQGAMQELLKPKKGWEVKRLGEICDVIGGGTPSTFNSNYWNGTIDWFTPTEVGLSKYIYKSQRKITKDGLYSCSARILPIGTILLTTRAGIGDLGILMAEACTNQGFQSLVAKRGINNEFVYYLMSTLKNVLIQNASGSTFLEISPSKIKQIEINIPSALEQNEIATILSEMDEEITMLESKLEKHKQIKSGMMQNLLTGKIRLV